MSTPSTLAPSIGAITERRQALLPGRLRPGPWALAGLGLLVLMLAAYLVLGWSTPGDRADMENGKTWIRWLTRNGLPDAYRMALDYPPVPLYLFALAGAIYQSTVDPSFNERAALASQTMTLLWKLPGITFHFALAGLIYLLARSRGPRTAFLATAA